MTSPWDEQSSFFLYDLEVLRERARHLKSLWPQSDYLFYAMKANNLRAILSVLKDEGYLFDFASLGEASQLEKIAFDFSRSISTGPAKSRGYLEKVLNAGCELIVLESLGQLQELNALCREHEKKVRALLRIQLDWESSEESVLGGSSVTPFGLSCDEWQDVRLSEYPSVLVEGVHCFQWGNQLEVSRLFEIWRSCASEAQRLAERMQFPLKVLDVGGGLGVDYQQKNSLDFSQVVDCVKKIKKEFDIPSFAVELGRYLVADCGKFYTRVVDRKKSRGVDLLVLASGMNALLRPSLTSEAFPVQSFASQGGGLSQSESQQFQLHGPLCTGLDCLGTHSLPKETNVGDWLEFSLVGAYGFSESMPFFLGHELPAEWVRENGVLSQVRQAMPPQEYLR